MDSMPPCVNALEIAKTKRRMAFGEATRLVSESCRENYIGDDLRQWCTDLDKALDDYDEASAQICSLKHEGAPCDGTCTSAVCRTVAHPGTRAEKL